MNDHSSLFSSPIARKKKQLDGEQINSYRIFGEQMEYQNERKMMSPVRDQLAQTNILGQPGVPPISQYRARNGPRNRPNPTSVSFLYSNTATLLEPICTVFDGKPDLERFHNVERPLKTTVRNDFTLKSTGNKNISRHSYNPYKVGKGIVPVCEGEGTRYWKEGLSYEHCYDSRQADNYPIRSKRHGAFVWDELYMKGNKSDKQQIEYKEKPFTSKPNSANFNKTKETHINRNVSSRELQVKNQTLENENVKEYRPEPARRLGQMKGFLPNIDLVRKTSPICQ